jgi:hypothetical protein
LVGNATVKSQRTEITAAGRLAAQISTDSSRQKGGKGGEQQLQVASGSLGATYTPDGGGLAHHQHSSHGGQQVQQLEAAAAVGDCWKAASGMQSALHVDARQ